MNQFQTPPEICDYMVSLVPLVTITVLEPTPGEGNIVAALLRNRDDYLVTAPRDFWSGYIRLGLDSYDCVVMNPPFTPMKLGYRILFECMKMSDCVIALMPWLTIINSQRRTDKILEYGLKSVTHLPRSVFPGSRVQTCILEMKRGWAGAVIMSFWKWA